jgi:hypothetical protein
LLCFSELGFVKAQENLMKEEKMKASVEARGDIAKKREATSPTPVPPPN